MSPEKIFEVEFFDKLERRGLWPSFFAWGSRGMKNLAGVGFDKFLRANDNYVKKVY